jgi:hypothetical protein
MTKIQLLEQLTDLLSKFNKAEVCTEVHLTFSTIGLGVSVEDLWWDENLMMFITEKPQ